MNLVEKATMAWEDSQAEAVAAGDAHRRDSIRQAQRALRQILNTEFEADVFDKVIGLGSSTFAAYCTADRLRLLAGSDHNGFFVRVVSRGGVEMAVSNLADLGRLLENHTTTLFHEATPR